LSVFTLAQGEGHRAARRRRSMRGGVDTCRPVYTPPAVYTLGLHPGTGPGANEECGGVKQGGRLTNLSESWMREQRAKLSRGNDVAKAMEYMLKRWPAFTRFLDDGGCAMATESECIEYARECVRLAGLTDDPVILDRLLEIARD
jgi:hypothetical protein